MTRLSRPYKVAEAKRNARAWLVRRKLNAVRRRLDDVGSSDPDELMRSVPISEAKTQYGIGVKTAEELRSRGIETAAGLWNFKYEVACVPDSIPWVGPDRQEALTRWVDDVRQEVFEEAHRNKATRAKLELELESLTASLAEDS